MARPGTAGSISTGSTGFTDDAGLSGSLIVRHAVENGRRAFLYVGDWPEEIRGC